MMKIKTGEPRKKRKNKERKLPSLKGFRLYIQHGDMVLECAPHKWHDSSEVDVVRFIRSNRRWRHSYGMCCSVHNIASRIFDFDNPTASEMTMMGGYVEAIGKAADSALEAAREWSDAAIDRWKKARVLEHRSHFQDEDSAPQKPGSERDVHFVYFMKHRNGLTKIGLSRNPAAREKTLQAEDPMLNLLFYFEADRDVERRMHRIFACVRRRGEWFELHDRHIDWAVFLLRDRVGDARRR